MVECMHSASTALSRRLWTITAFALTVFLCLIFFLSSLEFGTPFVAKSRLAEHFASRLGWCQEPTLAFPPRGLLHDSFDQSAQPRTRRFNWTITRGIVAPDGVEREMYLTNGQFPGPTIEANVGDTVIVQVHNAIDLQAAHIDPSPYSSIIDDVLPEHVEGLVSLHWHGLTLRGGNPDMDGATGFTSCAIRPGHSRTYTFTLTEGDAGTHWWHSHVGVARSDGLWGALVVHNPLERQRLAQAGVTWGQEAMLALGDHKPARNQLAWFLSRKSLGYEPVPDGGLVNGRNVYTCDALAAIGVPCHVQEGKRYTELLLDPSQPIRLRIVNTGAVAEMILSIDEPHQRLTVVEADGHLVRPTQVQRLSIASGQRYSVILQPTTETTPRDVWIRAEMSSHCFNYPNPALNLTGTLAILRWDRSSRASTAASQDVKIDLRGSTAARRLLQSLRDGESGRKLPTSIVAAQASSLGAEPCHDLDPSKLVPLADADPAPSFNLSRGDMQIQVSVTLPKLLKHSMSPMSYLNRSTWRSGPTPLLHTFASAPSEQIYASHSPDAGLWLSHPLAQNSDQLVVSSHPTKEVTIELMINNRDEAPHPFHLHGHSFWVMELYESEVGWGDYDSVHRHEPLQDGQRDRYDLKRAARRDTVSVPRRGYAVLRWRTDNPGVWALHCHVLVHQATDMSMAFVDQPARIRNVLPNGGVEGVHEGACENF